MVAWKSVVWVVLGGIGCADAGVMAPVREEYPPPEAVWPLSLETFEGSGQAVHPDPVHTPVGWRASQSFLVATPYPNGNAIYESPSFYEGTSLLVWRIPDGAANPVVQPSTGYLSDPDQLYNPVTQEIWLYYRQVTTMNQIWLVRSRDGVQWGAPVLVVSVPNHLAISPTVVRKSATDWWMWTVNGGVVGCSASSTTVELRRSSDGLEWSAPMVVMQGGMESPWHIDVTWVPERGEFWALYNAKTPGSCTTELLRIATSNDGVHWRTFPAPLLARGAIPEFSDVVYRSSLIYDAASDRVTLWYSGAHATPGGYDWRVATQQMTRATMFAIASGTIPQAATPLTHTSLAPDIGWRPGALTNETAP